MRVVILFVLTILFGSVTTYAREYPPTIVKQRIQKQYDTAKFQLYLMYCDQRVIFNEGAKNKRNVFLGTLPLKFNYASLKHDTVKINFLFYYEGKPVDRLLAKNILASGCFFKLPSDQIIYFSTPFANYYKASCRDLRKKCSAREVNPYQPEVLRFLRKNKDKLDPWFRMECIKRGLIKD